MHRIPVPRHLPLTVTLAEAIQLGRALGLTVTEDTGASRVRFVDTEGRVAITGTQSRRCNPQVIQLLRRAAAKVHNGKDDAEIFVESGKLVISKRTRSNGKPTLFSTAPDDTAVGRTATWERITPELAEEYLKLAAKNPRKLNDRHVLRLAEEMERDQWMSNGEPIIFDENGVLIDGQHRLAAIVLVGKPQIMLVVRGVPAVARETIDIVQRKRSVYDTLHGRGIDVHTSVVAAVKFAVLYRNGERNSSLLCNAQLNNAEHVAFCDMFHEPLTRMYSAIRAKRGGGGTYRDMQHSILLAPAAVNLIHLATKVDQNSSVVDSAVEQSVRYLLAVATGVNLPLGSPMYALRSWAASHDNPLRAESAEASVVAWNAFVTGKELRIIRNVNTGTVREIEYTREAKP